MREKGFTPVFIVILLFLAAGVVIYIQKLNNNEVITVPTLSTIIPQQETPENTTISNPISSNPLNRIYYFWEGELEYVDGGSGEKEKINHKIELPDITFNDIDNNPTDSIQLSPDKNFIIFIKDNNLWRIGTDGNNLRQLTNDESDNKESDCPLIISKFILSPDSQKIYYSIKSDYYYKNGVRSPNGKICSPIIPIDTFQEWVVDLMGQKQKINRPIDDKDSTGKLVAWSPDNKGIYYSYQGGITGSPTGDREIKSKFIEYKIEDETTTQILQNPVDAINWDKSNNKGFYTNGPAYSSGISVYLINRDFEKLGEQPVIEGTPKGEALLTSEYKWAYWQPQQISPDGKNVVLIRTPQIHHANSVSDSWENRHLEQKSEVYLWNTDNNQKTKLEGVVVNKSTRIKWTSDGSKLIYHTYMNQLGNNDPHSDKLYTYDIKSKQQTILIDFEKQAEKDKSSYKFLLY